ncbi:hypothetical protein U2G91_15535 [Rhodococcoides fascians]|uniref:hypothetical protein n=1 Tax=Rhodococcoides fascians TaxID=1828 RepID=UPI002ACDE9C4|nr:hypothetical protein [Rhodococcus fascians]WQH26515.1 hypothetical protein U2G91_15535 [Rhodococcus fascians]
MSYDATFKRDGTAWAVELRDGMMHTYKNGEWVGATIVADLPAIPTPTVIEPDPEPEIESVEAL